MNEIDKRVNMKTMFTKNVEYNQWISRHYSTSLSARTKCEEATEQMVNDFPELTRVRGEIEVEEPYNLPPTKTFHWWCVTGENIIVDPTGHQYPTKILKYIPVDLDKGTPTGKCMHCGSITYNHKYVCCKNCEEELRKMLVRK